MPDLLALNGQIIGGVPLPAKNYVKLWENQSPTSGFIAQDITLSSDDYDMLLIQATVDISSQSPRDITIISVKGTSTILSTSISGTNNWRSVNYKNNTLIAFSGGFVGSTANNGACVPVAIYGIKKDALAAGSGGAGGGHIIEDAEGTDLDQQDILQFKGTLRATNDAQNGKTIIDDSAIEIEWEDWQAMTEAQREAYLEANPKVDILNFPDADADLQLDFMTNLWENENPSVGFEAQNITLDSNDYDFLLWVVKMSTTYDYIIPNIVSPKGKAVYFLGNGGTDIRFVNYVNDTTFSVQNATRSGSTNNLVCIPLAVYGLKKKITLTVDAIAENVSTSASKCMLEDGETSVEDAIEEIKDGEWTMLGYCNCSAQSAASTVISAPPASAKQIRLVLKDGTYDSNFWLGNSIYNLDEVAGGTMRQSYAIGSTSTMVNYQLSNNALSMNAYNYSSAVSGVVYYR